MGAWFKFENITPRSGKTYRAACRSAPARPVAALEAGQGHQSLLGAAARPVAGMDAGKGMSGQGLHRRTLKTESAHFLASGKGQKVVGGQSRKS